MPWMVVGDFNEIMYSFEKKGGRLRNEQNMARFRAVLVDCDLLDIGFSGSWFTWEKGKHLENNVRERLERGVANQEWWGFFPKHSLKLLPHTIFYHFPLLVSLGVEIDKQFNKRGFRFNAG